YARIPAPVLKLPFVIGQQASISIMRIEKDALYQRVYIVAAHALDDGQPFLVAESRWAEENKPRNLVRIAGGELHGALATEAVGHKVIGMPLHERIEVVPQLFDEEVDVHRQALVDAPMQNRPVVGQEVRLVHVEVPPPRIDVAVPALGLLRQAVDEDQ